MPQRVVLHDQTHGRPPAQALVLDWQDGVPLTPRVLIAERVRTEWDRRDNGRAAVAEVNETTTTTSLMRRLNPFRRHDAARRAVAVGEPETLEHATASALDGFTRNAFFLVVDGRQVTQLDETIRLRPTSNVTFVRLVPLDGG